ncbi:peptide synthase [Pseudonocardia sp. AL041005-10]|nr:peptide synthase [Pseudonocardia sp. AL041005-10]
MIPLSFAQRRLWFVDRFEGPSATYNAAFALYLTGPLDVEALQRAFGDVLARHEVLRTVITEDADGVAHQRVLSVDRLDVGPPVSDLLPADLPTELSAIAVAPFDLAVDIPIRARLLRSAPDKHVLALVMHHIATDGESLGCC